MKEEQRSSSVHGAALVEIRSADVQVPGRSKLALAGILIAVFSVVDARAQDNTITPTGDFDVGVYVSPPFVEENGPNTYSGMAIDLWELIAQQMGISFRYVSYPTYRDLVQAIAADEVDAAVTNLTITPDRAEAIAFTQPWYDAGLRIMVPDKGGGGLRGFLAGLEDAGHLRVYAWILLLILVATVGITVLDRRFDPESPKRWREGASESFYNVMSIATSGTAPHKNLFGWVGRILSGLWLVVGVAVVAYITSSVTSVMTTEALTRGINSLSDLPGHTVAVFVGSVSEDYVRQLGIASRSYPGLDESVAALQAGQVDAIVADAPILEHYAHTHTDQRLAVVGHIFHPDKYGFGFPQASRLTPQVTLEILQLQEAGKIDDIRRKYLGSTIDPEGGSSPPM